MSTATDPFYHDQLAALAVYLEDADGMEIDFPEGLTDHGRRLMDTLGVTTLTPDKETESCNDSRHSDWAP